MLLENSLVQKCKRCRGPRHLEGNNHEKHYWSGKGGQACNIAIRAPQKNVNTQADTLVPEPEIH